MNEIAEILFDERTIKKKVKELADRMSLDYAGKEPVLVSILKGAIVFTADLMRALEIPATIEFVQASSYGDATVSSRTIVMKKDVDADAIKGKDVILVDCIIDTGDTMDYVMKRLCEKGPASLEAVVLLNKISRRIVDVPVKYIGFEIPDKFVVGYGLDYAQHYRCLPYIAVIKQSA
jgi:hypoxanthine phosphoribosyltransferase